MNIYFVNNKVTTTTTKKSQVCGQKTNNCFKAKQKAAVEHYSVERIRLATLNAAKLFKPNLCLKINNMKLQGRNLDHKNPTTTSMVKVNIIKNYKVVKLNKITCNRDCTKRNSPASFNSI